ncbi:thioredoxin domain-containing protein 15 isoform X2 [Protopterus annectens]|nr:thioredoxin domain-containing protein 15 isoform X2 [Protopterus annectens]XP_043925161.1 thioredoxin domain-containing protein 15 isoform X2 [Protopterus annectens]
MNNGPMVLNVEELEQETGSVVQYKTAEIADAVLGAEVHHDRSMLLSLIPGETLENHPFRSTDTPCSASEEDGECARTSHRVTALSEVQHNEKVAETSEILGATQQQSATSEESNTTEAAKSPKVNCDQRNFTAGESFTVKILNASQDLMEFLNANSSECTLVLFYTSWCRFSANLAPQFNALPRVFPALHFLALDASQHSSLSTRFGTVAVPNILLFQGTKPMARFNHTDRTLETLKAFLVNQTGIDADNEVTVLEEDYAGPLSSIPVKGIDWLLVFSVVFVTAFAVYATLQTESIWWLIPGHEHEHQE